MTHGIQVTWPSENDKPDKPDEIEFFQGIDVEHLDQIPHFTMVPAVLPRHKGGTLVEYTVDTLCERPSPGEVHSIR